MQARIRTLVVALVFMLPLLLPHPAAAIQYGEEDGGGHPFVGGLVYQDELGHYVGCSGTLVGSITFLTAAHCVDDPNFAPIGVTFDPYFESEEPAVYGIWGWTTYFASTGSYLDLALVYLETAPGIAPAMLAEENVLSAMAPSKNRGNQPRDLTAVGYGTTGLDRGSGGPPQFVYKDIRMRSTNRIINLDTPRLGDIWLQTSAAPGTGGGTCYGDSGGPFLLGYDVVVAITITGSNPNCGGNDLNLRIDNPSVRAWINDNLQNDPLFYSVP